MANVFQIKTYDELTKDELYEILRTRAEIFVVEQNCVYQDLDGTDRISLHVFSEAKNGRITSYARLFPKKEEPGVIQMGRVLTLNHGTGLGGELLQKTIEACETHFGNCEIYIEAQVYAIGFYEKAGFVVVSDEFLEDGIPHVQMRRPNK